MKYDEVLLDVGFIMLLIIVVQVVCIVCSYDSLLSFNAELGIVEFSFLIFICLFMFNLGIIVGYKFVE